MAADFSLPLAGARLLLCGSMRQLLSALCIATCLAALPADAKPLIGGPKTIAVSADGTVPGIVAGTKMGLGYTKGATQVAVPLIAVAFETSAQATTTGSLSKKSIALRLVVDDSVLRSICAELQAMVENDLKAQGFEILPANAIDSESRWTGITKDGVTGADVKDNFMSGFMGNGSMNRWYTAGDRPLFGTGAQAALSETSALIRTARERKISLLFYRFKVQFTELEGRNNLVFHYVKGQSVLHILSADLSVFTPAHTQGGMIILKENLTAGTDFVQELQGTKGDYKVIASPEHYKADSLTLIHAVSQQFAAALRKDQ
jgi:hypothetical protein